jgi:hypothetical protein
MSDYHHNEFIGFGTCVAPNLIPDWLYKFLFFPPIKTNSGVPIAAPYGLRKIEAQLLSEGSDSWLLLGCWNMLRQKPNTRLWFEGRLVASMYDNLTPREIEELKK